MSLLVRPWGGGGEGNAGLLEICDVRGLFGFSLCDAKVRVAFNEEGRTLPSSPEQGVVLTPAAEGLC